MSGNDGGTQAEAGPGHLRPGSSHPTDEDLSVGIPKSRALVTKPPSIEFSATCKVTRRGSGLQEDNPFISDEQKVGTGHRPRRFREASEKRWIAELTLELGASVSLVLRAIEQVALFRRIR
jgi:hypothetical protein